MEQIILNRNLKYLFNNLSMTQRGEVLTAIFEDCYTGNDENVKSIYRYIELLQKEISDKRNYMKELSAKGVAARKKILTESPPPVERGLKSKTRKEAKEKNLNKKILNLFSDKQKNSDLKNKNTSLIIPSVAEVAAYAKSNQLEVDAETFVNFYDSHGWMVGKTPIKNWQATIKLWHKRAQEQSPSKAKKDTSAEDETYWHELKERTASFSEAPDFIIEKNQSSAQNISSENLNNIEIDLSRPPFERFMERIKKYDIKTENNHD